MIKVMISDPDPFAREGVKCMLETHEDLQVTCEARSPQETFQALDAYRPDVCIVEIAVDQHYGLGFVTETKRHAHGAPILVVSHRHQRGFALRAMRAGAVGYLDKTCSGQELAQAVRTAAAHRPYLSDTICELIAESVLSPDRQQPHNRLSDREFEIFVLMANSVPIAQIAKKYGLGTAMARLHKKRIMNKMNLDTEAAVVMYAIEYGIIEQTYPV